MQYPKLWLFSTQVSDILGDRLLYLDLDVVVTGNFDRLIPNEYVDFKIWAHKYGPSWLSAFCSRKKRNQRAFYNARKRYNSSLIYLRAGSRSMVYDRFTEAEALAIKQKYQVAGSDQVWIYYALGPGQETWTSADGVYSYHRDLSDPSILPDDAKLVFFPGRWNPWDPEIIAASPWVTQHYPPQRPQR